jgi:hypothetical protein
MKTLYETPRGDHAPASSLTPDEAVALRDVILIADIGDLRPAARAAFFAASETGFAMGSCGPRIVGVRGPAFDLLEVG